MRHLLLCFLLTLSGFAAGQCTIEFELVDIECDSSGLSVVTFFVYSNSDTAWFSPTLQTGGSYNTDGPFVSPPFDLGQSQGIFFEGLSSGCENFFPLQSDCSANACSDFSVELIPSDVAGPCDVPTYLLDINTNGDLPANIEIAGSFQDSATLELVATADGPFELPDLPPGFYSIVVTTPSGCIEFLSLSNTSQMEVTISREGEQCLGNATLTATAGEGGVAPFTYQWSTGASTQSITVDAVNVDYQVIVTDANGCQGNASIFVPDSSSTPLNVPNVVYLECDGSPTTISIADPQEGFTYTWFGELTNLVVEGSSITVSEPDFYFINGVGPSGCFVSGFTQVVDLNLPGVSISSFAQDSICGVGNCFRLSSLWDFGEEQVDISWTGPSGSEDILSTLQSPYQLICGAPEGVYTATLTSACTTRVITYANEVTDCSEISGALYLDEAGNCSFDANDTPAPNFVVTLTETNSGTEYFAMTDADGQWAIELPLGNYTVEPVIQNIPLVTTCDPVSVTLSGTAVTGINLFLPVIEDCPLLTTEITLPFLRRCFSGCAYVTYENTGTATGEDAVVTVELDPFFVDVVPSIDPVSVVGNVYTFNVGDLPPFSGGTIGFVFTISCDAELGQSHCIEAGITPDTPCSTDPDWNGALVDITDVTCDGDTVTFTVTNIGENQMSVPLSYVIVEDGIMLTTDPFQNGLLEPGEDYLVEVAAEGSTVALITNQEPNAPGSQEPTLVFEGCSGEGQDFSTGFTNILPLSSGNPANSFVCRENVGSYDPNDKMGYPLGWGDDNSIEKGTRLDYEIRFQNTGTDTAFTVVISDTLEASLDLATLEIGGASHPFRVTIDTHRVLTFTFDNILLPDSSTNLLLSQGSVVFSIDHVASLEPGDEILNEAAIYFDFNEPVITNISRHMIALEDFPNGVRRIQAQSVRLEVFPNPVSDVLNLRAPNQDVRPTDIVTVTDLHGRPLISKPYGLLGRGLNVAELPAGYYLLLVNDAAGITRGRTPFVVGSR